MRVATVGLVALPLTIGGLGLAAAAVITGHTPLSPDRHPDPDPAVVGPSAGGTSDGTAIEGRRPHLTVDIGSEAPLLPPETAIDMGAPFLDPADEAAPVLPAPEGLGTPVPGATPQLVSTVVRPSPARPPDPPARSPGLPAVVADAPGADAPPTESAEESTRGDDPARPADPDVDTGTSRRPAHADTTGPPPHSDTTGRPDHAASPR